MTLDGRIDLVLDGGASARGLESTVVDLTAEPPRLLRPGLIGAAEIEDALGQSVVVGQQQPASETGTPTKSPGLSSRHYAPAAPVELFEQGGQQQVAKLIADGVRVGWLCWEGSPRIAAELIEQIVMPREPAAFAMRLYAALYRFDESGVERIVVDLPPADEPWAAIRDRLARAASAG